MATRKLRCVMCGTQSSVPYEAQTVRCPCCSYVTVLQNNYNGYRPYGANGNTYMAPGNTYPARPGYADYGRPFPQMNGGGAYLIPSQPSPPAAHGRKRAVFCGITYKEHDQSLQGSINDVLSMKKLLVERFGFPTSCILVLTEEEDQYRIPTKKNIRSALRWLVQGCQSGDSLVFFYSGHGSQVRDRDGDELDGFDESLVPLDYQVEGRILDDEINATIVRPLPRGSTLHAIIDTCFSGTFLDLPHLCRINRDGFYKWEDHRVSHAYKGTSGGCAISISACDDHQSSGDTTAFTGTATGALTYSFVQTLQYEPRLSYGRLLTVMRKKISAAHEQVSVKNGESNSSQEPQLSSSQRFDIYSKPFTL